jgi:hypothetical protein
LNELIIPPDVTQAATYIGTAWKQGVESIIETGRRLIEIRAQFKDERGKWSMLIGNNQHERGLLPFGATHSYRLIRVAEGEARLMPHVALMPTDSHSSRHETQ